MNEIGKITLLLCTLLALNASLADWYRETVMRNGISEKTTRQFEELPSDDRERIDTLILGDSHPKRGLYPSVLGDAFNVSIPGENYTETYYVLKSHILDESLDLRIAILPVDLHSLSSWNLDGFAHVHHYAPFVDYLEVGWHRSQLLTYAVRGLQGRYAPYLSGRRNILSYFDIGIPHDLHWLHGTPLVGGALIDERTLRKQSKSERIDQAFKRTWFHFSESDMMAPVSEMYFLRILELCAENQINVLLIQYPVTPEYLEAAAEYVDIEAFDQKIRALAQPYDNVRLVASRSLFGNRLDLFLDTDHLNKNGATRFSKMIKCRFLDPLRHPKRS